MKIEIDVAIPDGFEATGEYRRVQLGEWFLDPEYALHAECAIGESFSRRIILRKLDVPPTMENAGKDVLVRQCDDQVWQTRTLLCINEAGYWCYNASKEFAFCWQQARLID